MKKVIEEKLRKNIGASLLEVLISLLLLSFIFLGAHRIIHTGVIYKSTLDKLEEDAFRIEKVKSLIRNIINDFDSHRFKISPIIFKNGRILYGDGDLSQIANSALQDSDAILSTQLTLNDTFIIKKPNDALGNVVDVCLLFKDTFADVYRSFLLFSPIDYLEVKAQFISTSGRCRKVKLTPIKSFYNNAPKEISYTTLIPILRSYILFLDKDEILRYYTQIDGISLENQPILDGISKLAFNGYNLNAGIYKLNVDITLPSERKTNFSAISQLSKTDNFNLNLGSYGLQ